MSTPYGGSDPQQWRPGSAPNARPGGFPGQGQPDNSQPQFGQQYPPRYPGHNPGQAPGQTPQYGRQPHYGQQQYPQSYGAQQFGPPQPGQFGMAPALARPRRGKTLGIVTAAVVVVVAVVCVLGFWAPGFFVTTVLDQTAVQNGVKTVLSSQPPQGYGQTVTAVSCPANQPVNAGDRFDCTVTVDGSQKKVTITVQDSTGDYEVGQPH